MRQEEGGQAQGSCQDSSATGSSLRGFQRLPFTRAAPFGQFRCAADRPSRPTSHLPPCPTPLPLHGARAAA